MPEVSDGGPGDQNIRCPLSPDEQSLYQSRASMAVEVDRKVGHATDDPAIRVEDVLTRLSAEPQECRSTFVMSHNGYRVTVP